MGFAAHAHLANPQNQLSEDVSGGQALVCFVRLCERIFGGNGNLELTRFHRLVQTRKLDLLRS